MNLSQESEQLGWRDAFWRFLALMFVEKRLGRDPLRPSRARDAVEAQADVAAAPQDSV
jgi:hypothetical protein